jgi:glycosyltransferase involved in cell wall biosynthesis
MARIGINALYLIPGGVGGTEVYLRELLAALALIDSTNEYFVFTNEETESELVPKRSNFQWKPQAIHAKNRPARIIWEQSILPLEASRYRLDALFNPGFTSPIVIPCKCVTVFHDLQHLRHPEYFRWFDLPPWKFLLWASARRANRIIAVSHNTKADLQKFYGLPAEQITVVHHGVDQRLFKVTHEQTEEPFVLCVSTLHPHKNLERLIKAYARKKREFRLVLAGLRGFHTEAIEQLVHDLGLQGAIKITGWISREDLFGLYRSALACVQPSTFEGFGMPVLEAMAAGVPLTCSNIPPHMEIVGGTVLTFDPFDEDALADALDRITTDSELRDSSIWCARERAHEFTWEQTARETLQVLTAS